MSKEVAQVSRLLPAIVAGGLLALAVIDPALAHDCSSPADCEQTAGYNGTVSLVGGLIGIISTLIGGQIGGIVSGLRPGAGGTTPGTGAGPSDGTGGGAAVAPPTEAPIVDPWNGKPLVTWKPGQFGPDQDGNPGGPGDVWWGGRWLPPGEVRERIADSLAADERRARQSADFAADSQRKSDEWMKGRTAELQRQAADEARQRAAQNTLDQIRNIARNRGQDDIWERTQGGPAFRPDGTLDPDYVERLRGSLRGRIRDDMHAPLPDEPSSPLSDFVSNTFNDARHNPIVRIGTGILSGGTSEIAFQSGAAWDAMQQAAAEAGRKGRDIDFTDAFRAGMKQFGRENLPLDTIEALRDPKAGWTDIVLAGASDLFTGYDVASTARNLRGSISAARGGAGIGDVLTHQADPLSLWGKGDDPARWPGLKEPDDLLNASSGRASGGPADLGDLAKDSVEGGRSVRRPGMPEPEHLPSSAVERGTHVRNTLRDEGIREGLVERMGYDHGTPGRYGLTTKAGGQPAQGSVFDEAFGTDATSVRTTARHELDHVQQFDQLQTQGKPGGPRENWINPDGSLTKEAGRQMELEVRMNELDRNLIERDAAIRRAGGDPADPSTWPPEARAAQREVDDARNAVDRLLQNQPIGSDSLGGSSLAKDALGPPKEGPILLPRETDPRVVPGQGPPVTQGPHPASQPWSPSGQVESIQNWQSRPRPTQVDPATINTDPSTHFYGHDELGRPTRTSAWLTNQPGSSPTAATLPGTHRAHLTSERFGGLDVTVPTSPEANLSGMKAIENQAAKYLDRGYAVKMETEAVFPPGSQGSIPETVWHRVTVVDPQSGKVVADFGGMTRADTPYNNSELLFRGEQNFPDQTVGRIIH